MSSALLSGIPFQVQGADQLVSKVVSTAITALFKRSERVEANIRVEPIAKLLQGSVDSFDFIGGGLLMHNGLRIEGMELFSQAVSIDFSEIFQGRVKLRKPTQSTMRVVLTETDLSESFNTPFVLKRLRSLQIDGNALDMRQISVKISNEGTLQVLGEARLGDLEEWRSIDFTARVELQDRRKIQFVDVVYVGDQPSVELSQALVDHVNSLLDLDQFALDGTRLRVDRVRVREHKAVFYGTAEIDRFPKRK